MTTERRERPSSPVKKVPVPLHRSPPSLPTPPPRSRRRSPTTATTMSNYNFDFGLGSSNRSGSRPLKEQKNPTPATSTTAFSSVRPSPTPTWAPNKPSWTHQPAPSTVPPAAAARSGLSNPNSMVGDIFGKSWASTTRSSKAIGIVKSDPHLFGDLVGSALGQGRGGGNAPLKAALPPAPKNSFSMGNLSDSLPKAGSQTNPMRPTSYGSAENLGSYQASGSQMGGGMGSNGSRTGAPLGGHSLNSMAGSANQKKDPFESLVGSAAANASTSLKSNPKGSNGSTGSAGGEFSFGGFRNAAPPKVESFGMPPSPEIPLQKPEASQPTSSVDPLDTLFASSISSSSVDQGSGRQTFTEANDWDLGAEFGASDGGGATTELEGLPPPPAGVTSSIAKTKGLDNYKQGQFADAIKWLSWAFVLVEKSGNKNDITEVLSCRASCYKEVGEYKKAVADCSKVLENDSNNVPVLLQRALLYESTEKYKLGAEDLRTVLKLDPVNRLARTTIHRLTQLSG